MIRAGLNCELWPHIQVGLYFLNLQKWSQPISFAQRASKDLLLGVSNQQPPHSWHSSALFERRKWHSWPIFWKTCPPKRKTLVSYGYSHPKTHYEPCEPQVSQHLWAAQTSRLRARPMVLQWLRSFQEWVYHLICSKQQLTWQLFGGIS